MGAVGAGVEVPATLIEDEVAVLSPRPLGLRKRTDHDALVGSAPDTGDTVEAFTDFIDRLLTQVDSSPSGAPSCPHTREGRAFLGLGSCVPRLSRACLATRPMALAFVLALRLAQGALAR